MEENKKEQLTPSCSWKYGIFDLVQMVIYMPKCRYSIYSLIGIRKEVAFFFETVGELPNIASDSGGEENPFEVAQPKL